MILLARARILEGVFTAWQSVPHPPADANIDAGPGPIQNSLNLAVGNTGTTSVEAGSEAKGYPSLEGVSYTVDQKGNVTAVPFLNQRENSDSDLNRPPAPIPPSQ